MKIEVLVTTMHQRDYTKYYDMNLKTDAVIANQADRNETLETVIDGNHVKLVTTDMRGLSKNRNIALENSVKDTDVIIFSDDDLCFHNDYEQIVIEEFKKNPLADAIKFNINCVSERKIAMNPISELHRVSRREVTSWGVLGLAIKKDRLIKKNLTFNERFGTGTENFCGEDSIFLQELFKKGLKVFASPKYIADIDQSDSSWFEGYNEKYFITSGMIISEIYPILSYLLVIRSAYKFSKRKNCTFKFSKILKLYYKGVFKNRRERKIFK